MHPRIRLDRFVYVIMGSHLHRIAKADPGLRLSAILREFKKYTMQLILKEIDNASYESRVEWLPHRFAFRG
ncbi:MAG: hypothetical protein ACOYOA_11845 [Saprospiraceae bacterium]